MSNQIAARVIAATSPVDRLGALRAQIAALEKIETILVEEIKGWGAGVYPADVFSATVGEPTSRDTFDAAKAKKRLSQLGASDDWIANCVKTSAPSSRLTLTDL